MVPEDVVAFFIPDNPDLDGDGIVTDEELNKQERMIRMENEDKKEDIHRQVCLKLAVDLLGDVDGKLTPEQVADVEKLLEKIEEDDDVMNVYHTMEE